MRRTGSTPIANEGRPRPFTTSSSRFFGVTRRRVASFEEPVRLLGSDRGFIDLFWKGVLLVEQKSAGRDLKRAKEQALEYFLHLQPPVHSAAVDRPARQQVFHLRHYFGDRGDSGDPQDRQHPGMRTTC
ncbi:MAG: type IIL restriction-modification enzyme MmeI [Bryobacteraceae bacterium]